MERICKNCSSASIFKGVGTCNFKLLNITPNDFFYFETFGVLFNNSDKKYHGIQKFFNKHVSVFLNECVTFFDIYIPHIFVAKTMKKASSQLKEVLCSHITQRTKDMFELINKLDTLCLSDDEKDI